MGEPQVTREELRRLVDRWNGGRDDLRISDIDALVAAAEAVLRIERAPESYLDGKYTHEREIYRDGESHILAQLGALAPKEEG